MNTNGSVLYYFNTAGRSIPFQEVYKAQILSRLSELIPILKNLNRDIKIIFENQGIKTILIPFTPKQGVYFPDFNQITGNERWVYVGKLICCDTSHLLVSQNCLTVQ
ncbi:MAG TPA: hypothetical protein DCE41_22980 [Cytophagales bacterium]|nr:hypothetical protein [Cytophagales bacterium]HAA22061.1 hypothetical protein [Cytophagales bacterium]HAP60809.1 hypothetical protein [Cytophagales bacterium]